MKISAAGGESHLVGRRKRDGVREYVTAIDPDDPDWIRWTSLREDLRLEAHERDVEHAVFALLRVLQGRYPEPVVEAGLTPERVLSELDLREEERKAVVERLRRDSTNEEPLEALPQGVRALLRNQETSG